MFERMRTVAKQAKRELDVYRRVLADPRTPFVPTVLLGAAVGYLLMPFDLIPDFIPVLGQLDDILIVPGLVLLALRFVPREVLEEHREAIRQPK
jgi:uncharacterized membrane protein YkvA (DUF1232 family)